MEKNGIKSPYTELVTPIDAPVMMVYFTTEGTWRGFVHPYNIRTEMKTKKEAVDALRAMTEVYQQMLEENDFPPHLTRRDLSNPIDRAFFERNIDTVMKEGLCHVETLPA